MASRPRRAPDDDTHRRRTQIYIEGAAPPSTPCRVAPRPSGPEGGHDTAVQETEAWLALAREDLDAAVAGVDAEQLGRDGPRIRS